MDVYETKADKNMSPSCRSAPTLTGQRFNRTITQVQWQYLLLY